jgi:hypothetical protein
MQKSGTKMAYFLCEGEHVIDTWWNTSMNTTSEIAQIASYAKSAVKEPNSRTELVKLQIELVMKDK